MLLQQNLNKSLASSEPKRTGISITFCYNAENYDPLFVLLDYEKDIFPKNCKSQHSGTESEVFFPLPLP